jgi:hypothetical protein
MGCFCKARYRSQDTFSEEILILYPFFRCLIENRIGLNSSKVKQRKRSLSGLEIQGSGHCHYSPDRTREAQVLEVEQRSLRGDRRLPLQPSPSRRLLRITELNGEGFDKSATVYVIEPWIKP